MRMLDRLLSPAVEDEEVIARGRVLNLLALIIALFVPLYTVVTVMATPGQITAGAFIGLGIAFVLSLVCYWLAKRGHVQWAAYLLFVGIFAAISFYMTDPGNKISDLTAAPVLYILIILPAGYVIHPLASFVITTLAALYTFGLLWLAPPAAYMAYDDKASFVSNIILVFALAYILSAIAAVFSRGLRDALRQTRRQNRELQEFARELEAKRQSQFETGQRILELADRLTQFSARQARGSSRQAAAIAQVSSSIEELNQAAREIAQSAGSVDEAAQQTWQNAQQGQDIIGMHNEAMGLIHAKAEQGAQQATSLAERLQQISRVATIMSNIASQIQLVAFNATLEAAEVGETGRRFGVVAAEVKDLAADSLQGAKQVAEIIRQVQEAGETVLDLSNEQVQAVQMGATLMSRSNDANQAIITSASQMAERARLIQQTTAQQQQASEQVLASMREIKSVVDRWVVSSYQMDELVSGLQALVSEGEPTGATAAHLVGAPPA
jgi:methyl-accepting chemotaxis protein